jgi:hypothetical protein
MTMDAQRFNKFFGLTGEIELTPSEVAQVMVIARQVEIEEELDGTETDEHFYTAIERVLDARKTLSRQIRDAWTQEIESEGSHD